MRTPKTSPVEAAQLLRADQELLLTRIDGRTEAELRAPYRVTVAEIEQYDELAWADPSTGGGFDGGIGALAEYAATPPDGIVFGHAARHLQPAPVSA
jgi:hypothetical protein